MTVWRRWCTGRTSAHLLSVKLVYMEESPSLSSHQVRLFTHLFIFHTSRCILRSETLDFHVSDLGSPEGIAIDHLGRNMFWTDSMKDRIEVSSLDGSKRRVLIDTGLVNPRAILTDPTNGCVTVLNLIYHPHY